MFSRSMLSFVQQFFHPQFSETGSGIKYHRGTETHKECLHLLYLHELTVSPHLSSGQNIKRETFIESLQMEWCFPSHQGESHHSWCGTGNDTCLRKLSTMTVHWSFFFKIQTVPVFVGTSLSVFGCRYKWQIFPCSMKTTPYLHSESQYTWLSCFFPLCSGTGQWHQGVGCWFRKDQRALWICLHQRVLFWFPCRFWLCLEDRHLYISLGI